jgi:NAD-dependent deacetylase
LLAGNVANAEAPAAGRPLLRVHDLGAEPPLGAACRPGGAQERAPPRRAFLMAVEELELDGEVTARLRRAERAVVFTGAGVSQESGLATFRGAGGLWEQRRPEELATPEAFQRTPGQVWRWYVWRHARAAAAEPNPAHAALVRWETLFPSFLLVTQNVDDLHRRAGSRQVVELHGTLAEARCNRCGRRIPMAEAVAEAPGEPPRCRDGACAAAGGRFRPAVVWFGEALPAAALEPAMEAAAACDLMVSVGTSAVVYPAAGLIELALAAGALLIEINPEPTPMSSAAHLRLAASAATALPLLTDAIAKCRNAAC